MNAFIAHMLENSMFLSFAIILLAGAGKFLHEKTSPGFRYALWLLIVAGLLLPYRPAPFTVSIPENAPAAEFTAALGQINYYGEQARQWLNETLADDTGARGQTDTYVDMERFPYSIKPKPEAAPAAETPLINMEKLLPALKRYAPFTIWALGAVAFIFICALGHTRFVKTIVQNSVPINDGRLAELVGETRHILRLKRRVRVVKCTVVTTPLLLGVFKPVIAMPAQEIDEEKTRLMLLHEMLHIKRLDMCVKLFALAAAAAHWFNPLAYLMCRTLAEESERACDRAVIKHAGSDNRYAYCETLFSAARGRGQAAVMSFGLTGGGRRLKKRAETILKTVKPKKRLVISLTTLLLAGVLLSGGLFACSGGREEENRFGIDAESAAALSALSGGGELNIALYNYDRTYLRAVRMFEEKYDGWKVRITPMAVLMDLDEREKVFMLPQDKDLAALIMDKEVDIVNVTDASEERRLRENGMVADLLTLYPGDADEAFQRLLPSVLDVMTVDGRVYFMPMWFNMRGLSSWLFHKNPAEFSESWTWGEMADVFQEYMEQQEIPHLLYGTPRDFTDMLLRYNGYYLLGPDGEFDLKSTLLEEILYTARDLCQRGMLDETANGYEWNVSWVETAMLRSEEMLGVTNYNNYRVRAGGCQFYPVPRLTGVTGKSMQYSNSFGVSVNISPDRKAAAWEFIKIMLSEEFQNTVWGRMSVLNELTKEGAINNARGDLPINGIIGTETTGEAVELYNQGRQAFFADMNRRDELPAGLTDIVYAQARPFYEGLITYDECLKGIETELNIKTGNREGL